MVTGTFVGVLLPGSLPACRELKWSLFLHVQCLQGTIADTVFYPVGSDFCELNDENRHQWMYHFSVVLEVKHILYSSSIPEVVLLGIEGFVE